eukprot:TRINITY_DN65648_c1_g1_i3.p2 TRINITY_DN65648_c1_g1~~TRINITY_DN65648_c1_g1_i3.p2  ORF type:complete len:159 (-),score=14.67 TRINITY_DN65648_c1_g1_i3:12-488(-)
MTFVPTLGVAPLVDPLGEPIGNPALFNTTLGYFGPDDGDSESLDPQELPIVDGVRIVGWDTDFDGLADVGPYEDQPPGSEAVPFHGYGRIELRFDPATAMPDGILLPLTAEIDAASYREGQKRQQRIKRRHKSQKEKSRQNRKSRKQMERREMVGKKE